jgi:drug/metabolite transporter (DMT)-like permease
MITDRASPARGVALLSFTTFLWGTTFVVTQGALDHAHIPASELVLGRFLVAGIVFLPFLKLGKKLWLAAIELGITLWAGFATQTIGLKYTTVDRSAFITSMHVIFVPVLAGLMGRSTRWIVWLAAGVALGGVYLLSHDGKPPNRGDAWTLACAMVWALYIARLENFTAVLPSKALTAAHLWVVVILSAFWTAGTGISHEKLPWGAILYLGLAATAATTWFQTIGQKWVSAPQAAVLYTLEPLWAALFAWIVLHNVLGMQGRIGGALILAAAILTQVPMRRSRLPARLLQQLRSACVERGR